MILYYCADFLNNISSEGVVVVSELEWKQLRATAAGVWTDRQHPSGNSTKSPFCDW